MQTDPQNSPLSVADPERIHHLRGVLAQADYTDRGVTQALGVEDVCSLSGRDVPLLLRRTSRATPLDTLIRLFLIGVPVDQEAVRRAVAPMTVEEWVETGLLESEGAAVAGRMQLLPFQGLVMAFDPPRQIDAGLACDYVMGVGSSSLTLANLTVRRASRRTLDLGTGCGFQAFLAARQSTQVVAVDRNSRAVQIAAFNALLNGLENVQCLEGDLFGPVEGQEFDLVVSNPPFVISPESRYIYRDSGMHGDEVSQKIVRQAPAFLSEGGYCQILCNWAHLAGQPWQERLAGWFAGSGCDAWVMRSDTLDAASYAAKWIRHTEWDDPEHFCQRFEEWVDYYERERIEAISGGLITLRRRSEGANWFRADDSPNRMLGPAGQAILQGFEAHDFLKTVEDDARLMAQRLQVSPDVRMHQDLRPSGDGWEVLRCEVQLERGLVYAGNVDPFMAGLIAHCDGGRVLGELMADLAAALGKDPAAIAPACLGIVRCLVEQGFLVPVAQDR